MQYDQLNDKIAPFHFMVFDDNPDDIWASLVLHQVGTYQQLLFDDEGAEGNGYDWEGLALVVLDEKTPELKENLDFDPEAGMFCVSSTDIEALAQFALELKEVCDDEPLMRDLLSRADLD